MVDAATLRKEWKVLILVLTWKPEIFFYQKSSPPGDLHWHRPGPKRVRDTAGAVQVHCESSQDGGCGEHQGGLERGEENLQEPRQGRRPLCGLGGVLCKMRNILYRVSNPLIVRMLSPARWMTTAGEIWWRSPYRGNSPRGSALRKWRSCSTPLIKTAVERSPNM